MAMNEHSMNVKPPTSMTMLAGIVQTMNSGASLMSRKTPAFTIVDEWSRAEVGVGATMAPSSHVWKGIWAALVSPANARAHTATVTSSGCSNPMSKNRSNDSVPVRMTARNSATRKPMPPAMFMMICLNALLTASSVRV